MKTKDAIAHFGTGRALAEALGISAGAVSQWGEVVPELRQIQLERVTNGVLRPDVACYERLFASKRHQPNQPQEA